MAIRSTIPPTATDADAAAPAGVTPWLLQPRSLSRRLLAIAAAWIAALLLIGGWALDRAVSAIITDAFDAQLETLLDTMIGSAFLSEEGEIRLNRPMSEQRFQEPYSGLYWQVSARGQQPYRSRSLWDRALPTEMHTTRDTLITDIPFGTETVRLVERDAELPGSPTIFHFQIAQDRDDLDSQLARVRRTVLISLTALGLGLFVLAALQATYGLWPLRRVTEEIAAVRSGRTQRVSTDFVSEVEPVMHEINELLETSERQAEAARMQAGNLAHALKTPMTVLMGESEGKDTGLAETVRRQTAIMRRHVDHHLARARALGRRSALNMRTPVWPSLERLQRTIERMHRGDVVVDIDGAREIDFLGEQQDLEEMVGNLLENAAKYGAGRVFLTVDDIGASHFAIIVEDDGGGIPASDRERLFQRGVRLDIDKPGTGLGLAIVRDVAEIYGGSIELGESEDLGGLAARLKLPKAQSLTSWE